jgi:hypothetical protein
LCEENASESVSSLGGEGVVKTELEPIAPEAKKPVGSQEAKAQGIDPGTGTVNSTTSTLAQ